MAIPVIYNVRSVKARWTSAIVAVLGIAGTVGVFVAMLSLARGFKATLVASGSEDNAIIMRAGATSEMMSGVALDQVKIMQDAPGVARGTDGSSAGHVRSRRGRTLPSQIDRHRRERAGARRFCQRPRNPPQREDRRRPHV